MLLYQAINTVYVVEVILFFFFKQKTAYEMRISDWSSDVCSSDLCLRGARDDVETAAERREAGDVDLVEGAGVPRVEVERVEVDTARGGAVRSEERRVGKECVSTCR